MYLLSVLRREISMMQVLKRMRERAGTRDFMHHCLKLPVRGPAALSSSFYDSFFRGPPASCMRYVHDANIFRRSGRARTAGRHAATDNTRCAASSFESGSLKAQCAMANCLRYRAVSVWFGVLPRHQNAFDGGGKWTVTYLSSTMKLHTFPITLAMRVTHPVRLEEGRELEKLRPEQKRK